MSIITTIFRDYQPADKAGRSDRSSSDRARHRTKVRQSLKDNLGDVIADESLIGKSGDKIIKVPIRGIKEFRFVFGPNQKGSSQGDGNTQNGQVVGRNGDSGDGNGPGKGQAGDQEGQDIYETEITLDELTALLFEDLNLPHLVRKNLKEIPSISHRKKDGFRRKGIQVRLDKRKTAINRIKRKISSQKNEGRTRIQVKGDVELEELIIELYKCNKNTLEISIELGISEKAVNRVVFRAGILKRKGEKSVYGLNHKAFFELTDESVYWAGFIMADGCVMEDDTLQITLSDKDVNQIYKFYDFLDFEQLKFIEGSNYDNLYIDSLGNRYCHMKIKSKDICKDLFNNYGIVPRKSLIAKWPSNLNFRQEQLFLLGVFDGDGCIYDDDKGHGVFIVSSGSFEFLQGLKDFLLRQGLSDKKIIEGTGCFELRYYSESDLDKLYTLLYKSSAGLPFLKRKYDVFHKVTHQERFRFMESDRSYKHFEIENRPESNAVMICIMDTSGSMDTQKKFLARSLFYILYLFLRTKYQQMEVVFISHTTEAKEVDEDQFFHTGESGGTFISSGYAKALEIIDARYSPSLWNVYVLHASDGDNFESDTDKAVELIKKLTEICTLVGYAEIIPSTYSYPLSATLNVRMNDKKFIVNTLKDKNDIWPSLVKYLSPEYGEVQ